MIGVGSEELGVRREPPFPKEVAGASLTEDCMRWLYSRSTKANKIIEINEK